MVLTSWFFWRRRRKKIAQTVWKTREDEKTEELFLIQFPSKTHLGWKKQERIKKNLGWPTATLTYVKHPRGSFPPFFFLFEKNWDETKKWKKVELMSRKKKKSFKLFIKKNKNCFFKLSFDWSEFAKMCFAAVASFPSFHLSLVFLLANKS